MKHRTTILSLAAATCLAFSACGASTNEKTEGDAAQTEAQTDAQEPLLTLTSTALGEWKLGDSGKTLPKTFEGLYDKLEYNESFNEMDGIMERQYTATLKGEHTITFGIDENKEIDFISVEKGALIAVELSDKRVINPWEITVGELLAAGGEAQGDWPYGGMFITLGQMAFGFSDEVITNPEESESFGQPLKASDLDTTAKPDGVNISIYR